MFFLQAEDGIRDLVRSRGLGDVYKRQVLGLLSRGQQHGYDLKRQHDELFPAAKEIAFGQVLSLIHI